MGFRDKVVDNKITNDEMHTKIQVTQTASGLPKKSLEERKVENSKSFTLHVCMAAACL